MKKEILYSLLILLIINSCGIKNNSEIINQINEIDNSETINQIDSYVEKIRNNKSLPNFIVEGEYEFYDEYSDEYKKRYLYFERICYYDEMSKSLLRLECFGKEKVNNHNSYFYKKEDLVFIKFNHLNKKDMIETVKVYLNNNSIIYYTEKINKNIIEQQVEFGNKFSLNFNTRNKKDE